MIGVDVIPALTWPAGGAEPRVEPVRPEVSEPSVAPPAKDRLKRPRGARQNKRRLFDPDTGWFRRLERDVSLALGRHIYPRIPLIQQPYSWLLRRQLSLSEADIALDGLPRAFDGFRVLLISDVHAGPFVSPQALRESLERLQALRPDVILLGGDLTSSHVREYISHREAFEVLDAPHGVFAVLGNHDHYTEAVDQLSTLLEASRIRLLHNRSVNLELDGARLSLAGVDDLLRGKPDLEAALRGTQSPVILLSHNPDLFFEAARRGVSLMLSGHTHAGQMRVPGMPVIVRQSKYRLDEGRYRTGRSELVVSRGLGAVGVPWRTACAPEAVMLRLVCA